MRNQSLIKKLLKLSEKTVRREPNDQSTPVEMSEQQLDMITGGWDKEPKVGHPTLSATMSTTPNPGGPVPMPYPNTTGPSST
jgi:hypothetical protein